MERLREFKGTDFYAFQGMTNLPSGKKPMIAEGKTAVLVVGGFDSENEFGVQIIINEEKQDCLGYVCAGKLYKNEEKALEDADIFSHLLDCHLIEEFMKVNGFEIFY